MKFLIDLEDGGKIYFVDTERYDIHYFFARDFLSTDERPVEDHGAFNVREYRTEERRFVCGSLVHYLDSDLWTMELIAGDTLAAPRLREAFEQIRGAVYFGDRLRFRPTSTLHEQVIASLGGQLPSVTADEVFAGLRYQPLTLGTAFGYLRLVRGEVDTSTVRPDQVLVLEHVPDELPVSAGVITAELQAPLGHLALLCATRGTPNTGLRDALEREELSRLEGSLVAFTVGAQEWTIRPATRAEAEQGWAAHRPAEPLVPVMVDDDVGFRDLCTLGLDDTVTHGAKAAQLGELCQLVGDVVPPGFAIPFHAFNAHLRAAGIERGLSGMLADDAFRNDPAARAARLAELRRAIETTRIDPNLVQTVMASLPRLGGPVILRSSTNAEDLPGFTGAGLYRSVIVREPTPAAIADALRQVWASVWNLTAFEEREWYRVAHLRCAMGVIVQQFVRGAVANGVAITANPFYEGRPGVLINAQASGGSVTGAGGNEIPEQYLVYTYNPEPEPQLLSRSSRTGGAPVLLEPEVIALTGLLRRVHTHFLPFYEGRANAIDVEFLVTAEPRRVVLVQARPFRVDYIDARRWSR